MKHISPEKYCNTFLFLAGCMTVACSGKKEEPKPNFLFIMSDDHAFQAVSAYGGKLISTPNIDRIAANGVLFRNAFVTNSLSGPSRAVILTGKYSHVNKFYDNGSTFDGGQQTLPKILKANGYSTAIVGKWHLVSDPLGFDYWNILPGQGHYYNPEFIKMGKDTVYTGYVTDITADLAISWMEKNKSRPFLMMLHNKAPHRNWMPPLDGINEFDSTEFQLPGNFYDDYKNRPALQRQLITVARQLSVTYDSKVPCDTCIEDPVNSWTRGEWEKEYGRLTPQEKKTWEKMMEDEYRDFSAIRSRDEKVRWQFRRYLEDYLSCIRSVDNNVGRVLDFLKESGLDKNTVVIYMSDQGFYLGEHGLYDKRFMYEESLRTPMMISRPDAAKAAISDDFVMNLDIAPTILDLAGIAIPEDMQGISLKPVVSGEKLPEPRKEIYYHYYELSFGLTKHYGIRTDRYKLIRFYDPVDAWELYDLKNDPSEMNNIYNDPAMKDVITDLTKRLGRLQVKYGDTLEVK